MSKPAFAHKHGEHVHSHADGDVEHQHRSLPGYGGQVKDGETEKVVVDQE